MLTYNNKVGVVMQNKSEGSLILPLLAEIVNREDEVKEFNQVLEDIGRKQPIKTNLFEYYGGPGIGKTQLSRLLQRTCDEQDVPWISMNFAMVDTVGYLNDPTRLVQDMVADFSRKTAVDNTALAKAIARYREAKPPQAPVHTYYLVMSPEERLYEAASWVEDLRQVVIEFITLARNLIEGDDRPLVFFFDETERLDSELGQWIEEWIISPVAQIKQCVVIWTARAPWRWRLPEIRERVQSKQLNVFKPEDVKEQWDRRQANLPQTAPDLAENFFQHVYKLTHGHPYANAVAIEKFNTWHGTEQSLTPHQWPIQEIGFLQNIFQLFIHQYAFKELDADLKLACELTALVRWFDRSMLKVLLLAADSKQYETWKENEFSFLLRRLRQTQLLVWDKGDALDPNLRHLIRQYFFHLEKEVYITVNRAALKYHQDWLEKGVANRNLYVLEELYHMAALLQVGQHIKLEEKFQERLGQYEHWFPNAEVRRPVLDRLKGELENDSELKTLLGDDRSLIKRVEGILDSISEEHLCC
jgi:hypothetical protein